MFCNSCGAFWSLGQEYCYRCGGEDYADSFGFDSDERDLNSNSGINMVDLPLTHGTRANGETFPIEGPLSYIEAKYLDGKECFGGQGPVGWVLQALNFFVK